MRKRELEWEKCEKKKLRYDYRQCLMHIFLFVFCRFKSVQITFGLHYLWNTIVTNCNVKYLSLEGTHLKDEDIGIAYEALRHPRCLLQSLR